MTTTGTPGDRIHPDGSYHALPDPVTDRLFTVIMSVAAEVWTLRDRQRLLEGALREHGVDVERYFDDHRADADDLADMRADRDEFVARLLTALTPTRVATS